MDKGHSNRQQPSSRTASAQSVSHYDEENGMNESMHGTRTRKPAPRGRTSTEKMKKAPLPPPKDETSAPQRSIPPSTPTDPRKHRRTSSSFMEPTTASASRTVIFQHARPRERRPRPSKDFSPKLRAAREGVRAKIKTREDSDFLKSPVRSSNGISKRRQPQKPLSKRQTSTDLTLGIRTRKPTDEQPIDAAHVFEPEGRDHTREDDIVEYGPQLPPGWTQSSIEAAIRSQQHYDELHASRSASIDRQNETSSPLSHHFTPDFRDRTQGDFHDRTPDFHERTPDLHDRTSDLHGRTLDQPNQPEAFRNSSYGKERERDFRFPENSSPDTSTSGHSSSNSTGKSNKSWFPAVLWAPASPPRLNAEVLLADNKRLHRSAYHLREENKQLNASLLQLKDVNDQHASELRMLQASSFKDIAKNVWSPLEDRVIRETMEGIHKDIQDWAEENAAKAFYELDENDINEAEEEGLLRFLKEISLASSDTIRDQFRIWEELDIDPELILTAVATFYMYDRLYRNPFLILDAFETEKQPSTMGPPIVNNVTEEFHNASETNSSTGDSYGEDPDLGSKADGNEETAKDGEVDDCDNKALADSQTLPKEPVEPMGTQARSEPAHTTGLMMLKTYGTLMSLNRKQSQLWRSQLMRILLPTPASGSRFEGLRPADERVNVFLRSHCSQQVDEFLLSPARILFANEFIEESRDNLIDCWVRTIHLFTQLQTQLRMVRWTAPDQERIAGETFDETAMEGHCTQAFVNKDGRPVSLAVSPALVLLGNEDGQDYDTKRVVVKAVVCVEE